MTTLVAEIGERLEQRKSERNKTFWMTARAVAKGDKIQLDAIESAIEGAGMDAEAFGSAVEKCRARLAAAATIATTEGHAVTMARIDTESARLLAVFQSAQHAYESAMAPLRAQSEILQRELSLAVQARNTLESTCIYPWLVEEYDAACAEFTPLTNERSKLLNAVRTLPQTIASDWAEIPGFDRRIDASVEPIGEREQSWCRQARKHEGELAAAQSRLAELEPLIAAAQNRVDAAKVELLKA